MRTPENVCFPTATCSYLGFELHEAAATINQASLWITRGIYKLICRTYRSFLTYAKTHKFYFGEKIMEVSPSEIRKNIYNLLDQVLETGIPLEIKRKGVNGREELSQFGSLKNEPHAPIY